MGAFDKIKNIADKAKGRAKEAAGRLRGNRSQINEGRTDQTVADLKQTGEKAKDAFGN